LVQTAEGNIPVKYVSEEHQDWLVFRALPACERALAKILANAPARVRHLHADLQQEIGWDEAKMKRKFFGLAHDYAGVHTWTWWPGYRGRPRKRVDRRDIPRGEPGWVPIARCQNIPQAPHMQDSTESAIEMIIRLVKHFGYAYLDALPGTDPYTVPDLLAANEKGVEQGATLEHVQKCWGHMMKACRVMSGKRSSMLKLPARGKMRKVQCTDGGWVPRPFNG
jgi:hypothetical protein